jgi:hypothetical protein
MRYLIPFLMVLIPRRHSLITIFADTSEGGPLNVLLQENSSALLQEDGSYIIL